ncbi:uncharacterized protein N7477_003965 [Penicillium maclennaniae]|uniref:uncharacterized protein n=1 Tax=Penicillium maclennaniae TaxID=1343394 RepID=UPI0025419136|nr:uncharacterized protein N7477_003965 [Penicillium maclennaniae]KAJ5678332.1 hypothetical protein N7477_003965 [Penicillium maclennaniae]
MGHKVSVVGGVKSDNFYQQGNAINEIWLGDVELISRLPFGDSDLEQAGWPAGSWPKIPWHQFIIPLKRDLHPIPYSTMSRNSSRDCYVALLAEYEMPLHCRETLWNKNLISFLGAHLTVLGFVMAFIAAKKLSEASKELSRWWKVRVQVIPREHLPRIVKRFVSVYAGLSGMLTIIGLVSIFMGIPMMRYGLRGMSANILITMAAFSLLMIVSMWLILNLISLLINLRRILAALHRPRILEDSDEKPGPALNIISADKFDDRDSARHHCPECEKRSLFG